MNRNKTSWFDDIRIYHLLIDRFNGGWQVPPTSENVFCGGNMQGVIEKLDYIKDWSSVWSARTLSRMS